MDVFRCLTQITTNIEWDEPVLEIQCQNFDTYIAADYNSNTPGTAGGPGGRDRTLAVKSKKIARKSPFFSRVAHLILVTFTVMPG